jgi:hypothetical protein
MIMTDVTDEDDANPFDSRGILKDGRSHRVPLQFRDAAMTRIGFSDALCRNQVGPVTGVDRSAAKRAFEDAERETCEAWRYLKSDPVVTHGVTAQLPTGGSGSSPPPPPPQQRIVCSADESRRIRREAYDAMVAASLTAYRDL